MPKGKDASTGKKVTERVAARAPWVYKEKKIWTQDSNNVFWDHGSDGVGPGASSSGSRFWLADDSQYDVGIVKGQGAFATVFRAEERKSRRVLAVKRFHRTGQLDIRKLAREETKIVESMRDGPHIIQIGAARRDETHDVIEIPMDYYHSDLMSLMVATKTRRGLIKDSILVPDYYHEVLIQMLEALEYLHSKIGMIVHRDVQPRNILWKERGQFVLAGFSLARITPPPIGECKERRSFPYLAPEVYEERQEGFFSDIWSLGIVCLDMLNLIPKLELEHHALPFMLWKRVKWYNTMIELVQHADRPEVAMMVLKEAAERATAGEVLRFAKSGSMDLSRQYQPSLGLLFFLFREDRNSSHLSSDDIRKFAESYLQNPRPLPSPPSGWQRAPPHGFDVAPEDAEDFAAARLVLLAAGQESGMPNLDSSLEMKILASRYLAARKSLIQQLELDAGLQEPTGVVIETDKDAKSLRERLSRMVSEAGPSSLPAAQTIPGLQPEVPSSGVASQPPKVEVRGSPPAVPRLGQSKAAGSKSGYPQSEGKQSETRSSPRARALASGQSGEEKAPASQRSEASNPRGGAPAKSQSPSAHQSPPRSQKLDPRPEQTSAKASAIALSQPQTDKAQAARSSSPDDSKSQGQQASSVPAGNSGSQTEDYEAKTEEEPSSPPHQARDGGSLRHSDGPASKSKARAGPDSATTRLPPQGKDSPEATRSKPGPSRPEIPSLREQQQKKVSVSSTASSSQREGCEKVGTAQRGAGSGGIEQRQPERAQTKGMEKRASSPSPRGHSSEPPVPHGEGVRPRQRQQRQQQQTEQDRQSDQLVPSGRLGPHARPSAGQQLQQPQHQAQQQIQQKIGQGRQGDQLAPSGRLGPHERPSASQQPQQIQPQAQQQAQQHEDETGGEWKQVHTRTRRRSRGSRGGRGRF